ncbi:unnamed protein product [Symbiodinium microadriaticum]|nr:unnamed protein product [Symbiodinium microadriaticum]
MGQLAFIKDDANVADALPSLMDPGVSTTSQRHYAEGQAAVPEERFKRFHDAAEATGKAVQLQDSFVCSVASKTFLNFYECTDLVLEAPRRMSGCQEPGQSLAKQAVQAKADTHHMCLVSVAFIPGFGLPPANPLWGGATGIWVGNLPGLCREAEFDLFLRRLGFPNVQMSMPRKARAPKRNKGFVFLNPGKTKLLMLVNARWGRRLLHRAREHPLVLRPQNLHNLQERFGQILKPSM